MQNTPNAHDFADIYKAQQASKHDFTVSHHEL